MPALWSANATFDRWLAAVRDTPKPPALDSFMEEEDWRDHYAAGLTPEEAVEVEGRRLGQDDDEEGQFLD